jgi:hypothetical protein
MALAIDSLTVIFALAIGVEWKAAAWSLKVPAARYLMNWDNMLKLETN